MPREKADKGAPGGDAWTMLTCRSLPLRAAGGVAAFPPVWPGAAAPGRPWPGAAKAAAQVAPGPRAKAQAASKAAPKANLPKARHNDLASCAAFTPGLPWDSAAVTLAAVVVPPFALEVSPYTDDGLMRRVVKEVCSRLGLPAPPYAVVKTERWADGYREEWEGNIELGEGNESSADFLIKDAAGAVACSVSFKHEFMPPVLKAYCAPGVDAAAVAAGLAAAIPAPPSDYYSWKSPARLCSGSLTYAEAVDRLLLPLNTAVTRLPAAVPRRSARGVPTPELELTATSGLPREASGGAGGPPFDPLRQEEGAMPYTVFELRLAAGGRKGPTAASNAGGAKTPRPDSRPAAADGNHADRDDASVIARALVSYEYHAPWAWAGRGGHSSSFGPVLELIEVRPSYRQRGIGRQLVEAMKAHAAAACPTARPWQPARLRVRPSLLDTDEGADEGSDSDDSGPDPAVANYFFERMDAVRVRDGEAGREDTPWKTLKEILVPRPASAACACRQCVACRGAGCEPNVLTQWMAAHMVAWHVCAMDANEQEFGEYGNSRGHGGGRPGKLPRLVAFMRRRGDFGPSAYDDAPAEVGCKGGVEVVRVRLADLPTVYWAEGSGQALLGALGPGLLNGGLSLAFLEGYLVVLAAVAGFLRAQAAAPDRRCRLPTRAAVLEYLLRPRQFSAADRRAACIYLRGGGTVKAAVLALVHGAQHAYETYALLRAPNPRKRYSVTDPYHGFLRGPDESWPEGEDNALGFSRDEDGSGASAGGDDSSDYASEQEDPHPAWCDNDLNFVRLTRALYGSETWLEGCPACGEERLTSPMHWRGCTRSNAGTEHEQRQKRRDDTPSPDRRRAATARGAAAADSTRGSSPTDPNSTDADLDDRESDDYTDLLAADPAEPECDRGRLRAADSFYRDVYDVHKENKKAQEDEWAALQARREKEQAEVAAVRARAAAEARQAKSNAAAVARSAKSAAATAKQPARRAFSAAAQAPHATASAPRAVTIAVVSAAVIAAATAVATVAPTRVTMPAAPVAAAFKFLLPQTLGPSAAEPQVAKPKARGRPKKDAAAVPISIAVNVTEPAEAASVVATKPKARGRPKKDAGAQAPAPTAAAAAAAPAQAIVSVPSGPEAPSAAAAKPHKPAAQPRKAKGASAGPAAAVDGARAVMIDLDSESKLPGSPPDSESDMDLFRAGMARARAAAAQRAAAGAKPTPARPAAKRPRAKE